MTRLWSVQEITRFRNSGGPMSKDERTVERIRGDLSDARQRVLGLLHELQDAWVREGGMEGCSLHDREFRGAVDPEGCGACRGTGAKQ